MDQTLEDLEQAYREAYDAYAEDRTPENRETYKEAKRAFSDARTYKKQLEELDPDHPRGRSVVLIENGE